MAVLALASPAIAQSPSPVLKTTRPVVSIREGTTLHRDAWGLAPQVKPDIYEVSLPEGRPVRVTFISDLDSLSFDVEDGGQYDFVIQRGDSLCMTRIVGARLVPAAVFDAAYQSAHRGKVSVEVPEVYELVNVVIAMTATGQQNRNLIYHDSDYYAAVRKWFDPFQGHPAVAAIDSVLRLDVNRYASLKMNGYAFEFDAAGRIVHSRVYNRTGFSGEKSNALRSFVPLLQSFADDSKFRDFYRRHKSTYDEQISFYRKDADVKGMLAWLDRNFPGASGYGTYKIIFSPLVSYNQSSTWLESNGFRELQAHVNYPYPQDLKRQGGDLKLSKISETILRGDIVFTELNHGYINPEADRYSRQVLDATSHRDHWVDSARGPQYYGGISAFNEYMNWALVSLRIVDLAPAGEQQALIDIIDRMMTERRGFPQFTAFDAFLVDAYRHREKGQTVADLYPRIIAWFAARN